MFTGSLAMLHRALRLDARLLRTHLFRFGFALLIYAGLWWAMFMSSRTLMGAPGLKLFQTLTYLNVALIALAGISFFATAITEEKEEETLGLLQLAGLDPVGILLGKSTSRLVGAILLLLVQFPFTLLAITLGGVTIRQVLAAYCSLTAFMVLLANVGLLCSVACRRGGTASAATLLFLIGYAFAGPAILGIQLGLVNGGVIPPKGGIAGTLDRAAAWCQDASIFKRVADIMETGFADSPVGFQVLVSLAGAGICFGVAWAGFHRFTRDTKIARGRQKDLLARLIAVGRSRRSRPVKHPLAWKEFHFAAGGMPVQIVKFVLYGLVTAAVFWSAERYYSYPFAEAGKFVAVAMLAAIVIESSVYASLVFHDEWRDRSLPVLSMLPIRVPTIIWSKIAGCAPALIPALFWMFAGCLIWPDGVSEILKSLYLPSRWFFALVLALYLTLTAFFSLVVRWGALPLALAVMATGVVVTSCCGGPVVLLLSAPNQETWTAEGGFFTVDVIVGLLIFALNFDLRRRLEIAASQ